MELGEAEEEAEVMAAAIEARLRTGRPLAAAEWVTAQEQALARTLAPRKRGPKAKAN